MLDRHLTEICLVAAISLAALKPTIEGAVMLGLSFGLLGALKWMTHKESPDLVKLKSDVTQLKEHVERILLKAGR